VLSRLLPRYVIGPKPKRRTELGLLVFAALLIVALYVIAELANKSKIPPHIGPFLGVVLGLALVAHMANRWLVPQANAVVLPLAVLLNGIGYVVIARWVPANAKSQAGWAAIGVIFYVVTLLVVRFSRDLERYRYLLLLIGGLLLVAPLSSSSRSSSPSSSSASSSPPTSPPTKRCCRSPRRAWATGSSSTRGPSYRFWWPGALPW